MDESTSIGRARETAAPARVEDWGSAEGEFAELMLRLGYRSTVSAPIIVAGKLWGAVTIGSADPLPADAEFRLAAFCDLVSLAVASAQAREDLQRSRARIVRAGDEQRRRLERNLHDGAQQRLVAATLLLRVAQAQLDKDMEKATKLLKDAAAELDSGLEELRELARGLHPGSLTEHGLRGALASFEERLPLPVEITVTDERLDQHLEATAYFIVSEGLTNVVKHARASQAAATVELRDGVLRIEISRRRHGRRRHLQGDRPPRPPRPGRGRGRHARRRQPSGPRHRDHGDGAALRPERVNGESPVAGALSVAGL